MQFDLTKIFLECLTHNQFLAFVIIIGGVSAIIFAIRQIFSLIKYAIYHFTVALQGWPECKCLKAPEDDDSKEDSDED